MEDEILEKVDEIRDLGFLIDNKLNFSKHITNLYNKSRQRSFAIFKSMKTKKMKVLCLAYKMYVRSILESGSVVYNPYKKKDILLLERTQNMFTKRIFMRCKHMKYP